MSKSALSAVGSDDLLATGYRRLVIANMRQSLVVSVYGDDHLRLAVEDE